MEICFLITTYNRKESCQRLVDSLDGDIFVLNDGPQYEITGCELYYNPVHLGKTNYWHTVNSLWKLPVKKYDYYFMIPDDFLPAENGIQKAIDLWNSIKNTKKICMNLFRDRTPRDRCWTNVKPVEYKNYRLTQWVDMCFICEERFFKEVGEIPQIRYRWDLTPLKSSGVGSYISNRLHKNRFHIYQSRESLMIEQPENNVSQLNNPNSKYPK